MGVSNSYSTKLTRNGDFGANFNAEALRWKREIEIDYSKIKSVQKENDCSFKEATEIRRLKNPLPFLYKVIYFYKSRVLKMYKITFALVSKGE